MPRMGLGAPGVQNHMLRTTALTKLRDSCCLLYTSDAADECVNV